MLLIALLIANSEMKDFYEEKNIELIPAQIIDIEDFKAIENTFSTKVEKGTIWKNLQGWEFTKE